MTPKSIVEKRSPSKSIPKGKTFYAHLYLKGKVAGYKSRNPFCSYAGEEFCSLHKIT